MATTPPSPPSTAPTGPSLALRTLIDQATPEECQEAVAIAARLLARRIMREVTGQTDLTQPFRPGPPPEST